VAETKLKTGGLYRFSRNPMYLGFLMLNLGGMIKVATPLAILLGLYCSLVYHLIIIREEKFLEERFGRDYLDYMRKVRRYF
jgi:protein-S-isoprenylcysteine O-methyltransferase Ste14